VTGYTRRRLRSTYLGRSARVTLHYIAHVGYSASQLSISFSSYRVVDTSSHYFVLPGYSFLADNLVPILSLVCCGMYTFRTLVRGGTCGVQILSHLTR